MYRKRYYNTFHAMACHSGPIQALPIYAIWCVMWHKLKTDIMYLIITFATTDFQQIEMCIEYLWIVFEIYCMQVCMYVFLCVHCYLCALVLALRPLLLLPTTRIVGKRRNDRAIERTNELIWFGILVDVLLLTWEWRKMCATQANVAHTAAAVTVVVPQFAPETPAHFSDIICMINVWHQIYILVFHSSCSSPTPFFFCFFYFASFLPFFEHSLIWVNL